MGDLKARVRFFYAFVENIFYIFTNIIIIIAYYIIANNKKFYIRFVFVIVQLFILHTATVCHSRVLNRIKSSRNFFQF